MDPTGQIRLIRADAAPLAGRSLADARPEAGTDWTVVGVARDGAVHTSGDSEIESGDELFVAGSDQAVQEFERTIGRS